MKQSINKILGYQTGKKNALQSHILYDIVLTIVYKDYYDMHYTLLWMVSDLQW